ncbi:MAG: M4 family metallopeptidase [Anaerolineae bacterium]|nr:M4 family metallopeptidase [Anaerolineae bacterium]
MRISYHAETGKVRFIGTSSDRPITQPAVLAASASPEVAARGFLDTYGQLLGLTDQAQELAVMRSKTVDRGRSFVRFQQIYQSIPVLGGEVIVQLDANKDVISANGEVLPEPKVNVVPTISAETAQQRALAMVAKNYGLKADDLTATEPELWIYSPILLGGPGLRLTTLVWRMDVEPRELRPIRELVLVDAHLGTVALHFNQIDMAKNRLIYDNQNDPAYGLPGNGPVRTEGGAATGITDVDKAYDYAGNTYDFYYNYHGRDSIDNAGMTLINTVRYCPDSSDCPYANAFWNGEQMVYGEGYSQADDVVAHELTHGVTEYESHLFYYMQSGAINEAFSDIWGEFVDLTNGVGNDTSGVRWLIGEDLSGGAGRSMSNPPTYGDPDSMTSPYYYCGEDDSGGVHSNSGVANKAAYLMVDGGSFNGYTVTGMGITKVAKIFYEVQTNLFTSASDYQDLYDDLYQACINLIGTSGITAADCQEVQDAVNATQMNQQPTSCPATHAPICDSGSPVNLFFDDMENTSSGNWTSAAIVGSNEWYYPQTSNPYDFDATYATSGVYNLWGYNRPFTADYYMRMTSDVTLPSGQHVRFRFRIGTDSSNDALGWFIDDVRVYTCPDGKPYMHFNHAYAFEDYGTTLYDGGVLEYSTNSGASWNDAGPLFINNGYDGTISSSYGNPLGGRQAFGGESNGYISSRLDLSSLPSSGKVYLPVVLKSYPPSGPTPGFWRNNDWSVEFYVTTDRAYVDNFAIYVSVSGCGNYKITHTPLESISNNQFSFSGSFYASGTFSSNTTASGTTGLNHFYISGCGYVNGGPWSWSATWRSSSQPIQAELMESTSVEATDVSSGTHIFFDAVQTR